MTAEDTTDVEVAGVGGGLKYIYFALHSALVQRLCIKRFNVSRCMYRSISTTIETYMPICYITTLIDCSVFLLIFLCLNKKP